MGKDIREIHIKNIKGYKDKKIKLNGCYPNKINIFIAPNGFGKSSLAVAFKSLQQNKIKLEKENYHRGDNTLEPYLSIQVGKQNRYKANSNINEISREFQVEVINSGLYAKGVSVRAGGFSRATGRMEIKPIEIVSTIPEKPKEYEYSITRKRSSFGCNGKVLENIKDKLDSFCNSNFNNINLETLVSGTQEFERCFKALEQLINSQNTSLSGDKIKEKVAVECLNIFKQAKQTKDIREFAKLRNVLGSEECIHSLLNAYQAVKLIQRDKEQFKKFLKYSEYKNDRDSFNELLSIVDTTSRNIKAKESKGKLILEFPKAHEISNGQRDILTFFANLERVKKRIKSRNKPVILIIDEIFDYLDADNLLALQYYLLNLTNEFKANNKKIYPILLTHLDPSYVNHFQFRKKLVVEHYLHFPKQKNTYKNSPWWQLVELRNSSKELEEERYNFLSKFVFHYHPEDESYEEYEHEIPEGLNESSHATVFLAQEEVKKYINNQSYNPIAVALGVRLFIEETAYNLLCNEDKEGFLEEYTTLDRLRYAESKGKALPETYYLLNFLYNSIMHSLEDKVIFDLQRKLKNLTVHKIVSSFWE